MSPFWTPASSTLRLTTGLALVGMVGIAGYLHRAITIVPLLGVVFAILYIAGKLGRARRLLGEPITASAVVGRALIVYPVQIVVVGTLYLIGYGSGAILADRPMAPALTEFDIWLTAGTLIIGSVSSALIYRLEDRHAAVERSANDRTPDDAENHRTAVDLDAVLSDTLALGRQRTALPIDIFSLSRRLADHPDRSAALDMVDGFAEHHNAFVRRTALTAIRFMGQSARDDAPDIVDLRIVEGLRDPDGWVRYDAAWAAGVIVGDDAAYADALFQLIADDTGTDPTSAAGRAVVRARESLDIIVSR